jgi:hypothetical protein
MPALRRLGITVRVVWTRARSVAAPPPPRPALAPAARPAQAPWLKAQLV